MRIAIIGSGAIGCLFGARLTLSGNDVTLVHRDESVVRTIRRRGVSVKKTHGKSLWVKIPIVQGPTSLKRNELVVIATKAFDTKKVAKSYRRHIGQSTKVLSLQNGLGNVETLQSFLESEVLGGSTTEGAMSLDLGSILHTGAGNTIIGFPGGENNPASSLIRDVFRRAGFHTMVSTHIYSVLWTKAIVNAAINPLSALTGLLNGALVVNTAVRKIASQVIAEGVEVCRKSKVALVGDPNKLWRRILISTRENRSSMLQDVIKGRRTEILELNGAVVSAGRRIGVKTPSNDALVRLVLGIERRRISEGG